MANEILSNKVIQTSESLVQKIVFSMDTEDSVKSAAMALTETEPDEFWCTCTSQGTDVVQPDMAFDVANSEVDFKVTVENSGTSGTHVYAVFLKWYAAASQDGSSITVSA